MLFDKAFLKDRAGCDYVSQDVTGRSRWSIRYREVFTHEEKFYETCYQTAATEMQEERPYEDESDQIECKEVFPVTKIIVVYE